jgi:uncharacterized cupin superfamily protein
MPINETDVEWSTVGPHDTDFRRKQLGRAAAGKDIGCSLYELPAGERAWPYHYHTRNEEALYVLAGSGTLRLDGEHHDLAPGSYVALPTGEENAHRVVNDSDDTLRYLAISTMDEPDVVGYPDADALGVYAGTPPGGDEDGRVLSGFFRQGGELDFWGDVANAE